MFKPGIDDLVFMGFAQAVPTLFPFVEAQARLLAAYAVGRYALPAADEMERVIDEDHAEVHRPRHRPPRHTQQVDYFIYEHDLRAKEIPAGLARAAPAAGRWHDRPARPRGDRRRTALLESLDHYLREAAASTRSTSPTSRGAPGVTRSAFYFYFENKASAVAALMEEMYDESFGAADLLRGDGTPAENIEAMVRALFSTWDKHEHLFRASLDARATSATVRELWDSDRESFVPVVAAMIEAERAAGRRAGRRRRHRARRRAARAQRPDARAAGPRRAARPRAAGRGRGRGLAAHDLRDEVATGEARPGHLHLRAASSCDGWHFTGAATRSPGPAAGRSW